MDTKQKDYKVTEKIQRVKSKKHKKVFHEDPLVRKYQKRLIIKKNNDVFDDYDEWS